MFTTTHWTVVFKAAKEDSLSGRPALNAIVLKYWRPLYFFARQRGFSPSDAEDATQSFFSELIEGELLHDADPARGRFRSFLLTAWKRYLVDLYRGQSAQKRGGQCSIQSLDLAQGEQAWSEIADPHRAPDDVFLSSWAKELIDEAMERLRTEYESSHRGHLFRELLPRLTAPADATVFNAVAKSLDISPGAAKVALHRFRHRFAQTVREVTNETLEDPSDLEQEISDLLAVLAKNPK
jgi:RNA polymerase sigma factor (sigma-70 family)